ncbi:MAG: hypothetical protein KTR19_02400 [Hyphomicrobiales bacterium]|nr:hypothetical protein [Hyphomicrobiales bacterium]
MTSVVPNSPLMKVLAVASALFAAIGASQAVAQKYRTKTGEDWVTYKNESYGFRLYYPSAVYAVQPEADAGDEDITGSVDDQDEPNADGVETDDSDATQAAEEDGNPDSSRLTLVTKDGESKIVVFGALNEDGVSPREYKKILIEEFGGYDKLDYQPVGRTWFVLSGFRGDSIYYQKVMFSCRNRVVNVFSINFPTDEKPYYERLVEIMEDNFKTGRGANTPSGC